MAVDNITSKATTAPKALQAKTLQEFLNHAENLTHKALGFPRQGVTDIIYYTPRQILNWAQYASQAYVQAGLPRDHPYPAVVGLRVISTIESVVSFVALIRLGYTVLVLSPYVEAEKVASMMSQVDSSFIIDGTFLSDEQAARELKHTLEGQGKTIIPLLKLESLLSAQCDQGSKDEDKVNEHNDNGSWSQVEPTHPTIIIHSSGSTGVPKLVHKTHNAVLDRLRGLPNVLHGTSIIGSWLYYSVGLHSMLFSLVRANGPSVWSNELIPLEATEYREILTQLQPTTLWFNPANLMAAMETPEGLNMMRKCDLVVTTGGVFPTQLGDRLVQEGVHLISIYGMSELSSGVRLTSASRSRGDPNWEYVRPSPETAPHVWFRPLPDMSAEGGCMPLFELVILPSHPSQDKRFANRPDGSFSTGDIFVQHPDKPTCYKCIGRISDEIKISPEGHDDVGMHAVTYEHTVMAACGHILQEAVLFGRDRPEAGLLLFTKPACTAATEDEIVEGVFGSLQRGLDDGILNVAVRREMLIIIRDAVVPRTPKGNVVRPEVYLKFEGAINKAYDDVYNESGTSSYVN